MIEKFKFKLNKLNNIIKKNKIKPIFITQVKFDGLKDKKLYLINNELKKFSLKNEYFIIRLDELITMGVNDFYDPVHTTSQGSKKISNLIFEELSNRFNKEW